MRILITDGNERAALAATRSLVAGGYEVHVVAATRFSLAGASRRARRHVVAADPFRQPAAYADAVGRLAEQIGARVLLPTTDQSILALLDHRGRLPVQAVVPLPEAEAYRTASDKLSVLELARSAGFAVPETVVITSAREAGALPAHRLYPAVVKPHQSVVDRVGVRLKVGVVQADDRDACLRALSGLPAEAFPVLVQRRVVGPGEGLFVLRWDGRPVAVFAHRRLREKPPAGGVSVYRESIALTPGLVDPGLRLLEALDLNGVAMVECKRDVATGRHVIMEVNGRLWGSLQLAIDAGVDFPRLLVQCALGCDVARVTSYRVGVRSRWFWGDVDHLYIRLRHSPAALHLDGSSPSRLRTLWQFFQFRLGRDRCEVWRWSDPGPFWVETLARFGLLR